MTETVIFELTIDERDIVTRAMKTAAAEYLRMKRMHVANMRSGEAELAADAEIETRRVLDKIEAQL